MSISGLIATRGATARVRRAVQTASAQGGTNRSWGDAPTARVQILLEELTAAKAQRIWGAESAARFRGTVDADRDVRQYDVLVIESGRFEGSHLRVEEDPRGSELGPQLKLVGLALTKERVGL